MLLEVEEARGGYGNGDIVRGVSCSADAGEVLCLVGPNGCGKTTLFRLMLGILPVTGGTVRIDGREVQTLSTRELANLIAYIPQYHTPIYAHTVLDMVVMGRAAHFSAFDTPKSVDREAAFAALEKLGAAHLANTKYTALSGGQRQLVLLARAICQSAKIFVLDEPAAGMNPTETAELMDTISTIRKNFNISILLIEHDMSLVMSICERLIVIDYGQIIAKGTPYEIANNEKVIGAYLGA